MATHRFRERRVAGLVTTAAVLTSLIAMALSSPAGACIFGPWEGQVTPTSGQATLGLNPDAASVAMGEISLGTGQEAVGAHFVALPVRGGTVWTKSAFGTVNLGGTLVLRDGHSDRTVILNSVVVSLLPNPSITAVIPGSGPVMMFTLSLGSAPDNRVYRVGSHRLVVGSSVVRLTDAGATALDKRLGTRALSGGGRFGTFTASAYIP
jgi:hypothetical protein